MTILFHSKSLSVIKKINCLSYSRFAGFRQYMMIIILFQANTILNISLYTSPFICMYIYKRGFFTIDEATTIGRVFSSIGCILAFSFILRAYGRSTNPTYVKFLQALSSSMNDKKVYLNGIRQFDFEFHAWPATFKVKPSRR